MGKYPAVDVRAVSTDIVLATVDDFRPTAIEDRPDALRVFFASPAVRDSALTALQHANASVTAVDVDDEDWASRSQASLKAVTVGAITIAPPWDQASVDAAGSMVIVIAPSMGFGTGHHATTRLCLEALQELDLRDQAVLDVGTGSGVLAIAASRLGAAPAVGIDNDPDAIRSARENLVLNPAATGVEFRVADLAADGLPLANIIMANLTGALLVRTAGAMRSTLLPGGTLIVSGLMAGERAAVIDAFAPLAPTWEKAEDEWVALALSARPVK